MLPDIPLRTTGLLGLGIDVNKDGQHVTSFPVMIGGGGVALALNCFLERQGALVSVSSLTLLF